MIEISLEGIERQFNHLLFVLLFYCPGSQAMNPFKLFQIYCFYCSVSQSKLIFIALLRCYYTVQTDLHSLQPQIGQAQFRTTKSVTFLPMFLLASSSTESFASATITHRQFLLGLKSTPRARPFLLVQIIHILNILTQILGRLMIRYPLQSTSRVPLS